MARLSLESYPRWIDVRVGVSRRGGLEEVLGAGPVPNRADIFFRAATMEVLFKRWIVHDSERFTVAEVDARSVPGARGSCCLICESDLSVRRLWSYPADWNRMEDGRLLALFTAPLARMVPLRVIGLDVAPATR